MIFNRKLIKKVQIYYLYQISDNKTGSRLDNHWKNKPAFKSSVGGVCVMLSLFLAHPYPQTQAIQDFTYYSRNIIYNFILCVKMCKAKDD